MARVSIFRFFIINLIFNALLLTSCGSDESGKTHEPAADSVEEINQLPRLNHGQRWKINEEMVTHIQNAERIYEQFSGDHLDLLHDALMESTNALVASCTMTGPAHDELHKWLHPHIDLIKSMKGGNTEQVDYFLEKLEASFVVFHTYFE
jgi:hypothetical protein